MIEATECVAQRKLVAFESAAIYNGTTYIEERRRMNTASVIAATALLLAGCSSVSVPFVQTPTEPTAIVQLEPRSGSNVSGNVTFTEVGDKVRVKGDIGGHLPGMRGWHIHEKGDCSDPKAMSAGGHFNPRSHKHGAPSDAERHAGDMGNLLFDERGRAEIDVMVSGISTSSGKPDNIIGRALIIHMDRDDLKTDPTGNAGGRVACGVITAIYRR